jgi:glycosyltransferase involved in cell wall biosynthesis
MKNEIDIVVVSTACHTAINRRVYKEFIDRGISVLLIVPTELIFSSGAVSADPPAVDDPLIEYIDLHGSNSRLSRFIGITKTLNRYRPKLIVLDNDPISIMAMQIGLWAKINKASIFCISCENMSLEVLASYRRRGLKGIPFSVFKRLLLSATRKLVHGVFTINNEGTEVFKKEGFSNVRKIPLGFDPKYFRVDIDARKFVRSELGLEGFVIGFFGRIVYEKGVHILIDALERLVGYKWTLLIDEFDIYKNKYGEDIHRRLLNSGLIERVVSINPKHDEMGDFINAVDVVVMPSVSTPIWIEQYGRIAAEAMACGKVVVASDSGALPMLLNGHGILFDEGDVDSLVNILIKSMNDSPSHDYANSHNAEVISTYAHEELSIKKQMEQMLFSFEEANALSCV